ncbi:MAG TPA: alpha/beta fold hydrolase [Gammaproteobacteria bacterium]|nr:alpha/beta fold hydrolase [Gammaproteobacteria bacterium]
MRYRTEFMRTEPAVRHLSVELDGLRIFYREAGPVDAPVLLLLHGYPSSSHYFRRLMPLLAERYRLIAPDLLGFGGSDAPGHVSWAYSFDRLAEVLEGFVAKLGLTHYALYIFDYGAPVGMRLALAHPERITAIISQNGNLYREGLGPGWKLWERYWQVPSVENRAAMRTLLDPQRLKQLYLTGARDPALVAPEAWLLHDALLARPGNDELQLDLFLDYRRNVELYPAFQAYLRTQRPPLLAVWGRHDPVFLPAGAEAFRRDLPEAEVHFLEAGHFVLETEAEAVAVLICVFLGRMASAALLDSESTQAA